MATWRRLFARLLIAGGALALGWVAFQFAATAWYQRQTEAALESLRHAPATEPRPTPERLSVGEPIGTLEIARLGLTGVVVEGDQDAVLDRAIGHLPDTPLPGVRGTARSPRIGMRSSGP